MQVLLKLFTLTKQPFFLKMDSSQKSNPIPAASKRSPSLCQIASTDLLPPSCPFLYSTQQRLLQGCCKQRSVGSLPLYPAIGLMAPRWKMRLAPSTVYLALQGWEWDLMALHTRCCQTHVNDCIRVPGLRKLTLWCLQAWIFPFETERNTYEYLIYSFWRNSQSFWIKYSSLSF